MGVRLRLHPSYFGRSARIFWCGRRGILLLVSACYRLLFRNGTKVIQAHENTRKNLHTSSTKQHLTFSRRSGKDSDQQSGLE